MQIAAKQYPVLRRMLATLSIRAYMCSLEGGQCSLATNRTTPIVQVRHQDPKCALTQARANERRFAEARSWILEAQCWHRWLDSFFK